MDEPGSVAVIWHQTGRAYQMAGQPEAAGKTLEGDDKANEGRTRNNLANTLRKLRRLDEARKEIRRAIECKEQFGHASEPWVDKLGRPGRHRDGHRQRRRRR